MPSTKTNSPFPYWLRNTGVGILLKKGNTMGYPYGDTYLEQIQKSEYERESIKKAYYVLVRKYIKDSDEYTHDTDLTIEESFRILGEAFELESDIVGGISDVHHFMWDVLDALLGSEYASKD